MKDKQLMTLDELAHIETDYKLWTDKRSGDGMGYLPVYERYFEKCASSRFIWLKSESTWGLPFFSGLTTSQMRESPALTSKREKIRRTNVTPSCKAIRWTKI